MQKKRGIQFFFAILIGWMALFCLPAGYAYASQKEADAPLSMDVSYGFDNTAKSDRYLRVTVLLNNDTAPFEGTLEFLTAQSSLEAYQYSYPLSLAAGEKFKQEYYIPLGVRADQMFVSVQDVNGKTVIRKRLKLGSEEDVAESYIGILTDTPEALSYLDGAGIRYGTLRTRAVFLDAEQAPDDRLGYDPLDLVIVSGFDLDSLSDVQYEALRRWVEDGGTILFGGGVDCARNYGRFAEKVLEPPYLDAVTVPVSLGGETAPGEQTGEIQAECVDVNLKNGSTLLAGEVFPLLSHTNCKRGRIVAAAFSMDAISDLCLTNPSSFEKLYTLVLGSDTVDELAQEDYYGYSGSYFSVQGLVNTGNAGRLPKVAAYTVIVVVYLLLIGPGIYFYLKKRGIYRYYLPAVTLGAFLFTGIIYALGVKTRFREPFVTYASILDTSGEEAEEATYMNIRSPYNKPYSVSLKPGYEVRPMTRCHTLLEQVRLEDKEDFFVDGLSRGMKQRLCLARALIHDPDLLILDEPASGLDPRTRVEYTAILKELRDQGKTLLVSSHILSELSELCTSIGIIEQGRTVLQGSMDQIFARINSSNPLLISIFSQKEKALAILKSHPCVQTIAVQGDEIKLGFLGDRQDEALLLQQLIDADVMVSSFMREKGSLESLFMQITGHEEERAVLKHEMKSGI